MLCEDWTRVAEESHDLADGGRRAEAERAQSEISAIHDWSEEVDHRGRAERSGTRPRRDRGGNTRETTRPSWSLNALPPLSLLRPPKPAARCPSEGGAALASVRLPPNVFLGRPPREGGPSPLRDNLSSLFIHPLTLIDHHYLCL